MVGAVLAACRRVEGRGGRVHALPSRLRARKAMPCRPRVAKEQSDTRASSHALIHGPEPLAQSLDIEPVARMPVRQDFLDDGRRIKVFSVLMC
jgi:hypothetical protein